ncbi:MAG: hypothetical protein ACRCW1_10945 [Anaerotignaceae bacterium]
MSFFTNQLMKCTEDFENKKCIGNAMYIPLGDNNRLKLEFITVGHASHYTALSLTALDKNSGIIDKNIIKFADVWGKKKVSNPNFSEGIFPYIWKDGMNVDWYVYEPTPYDMEVLAEQINDYAELFMEQDFHMSEQKGSIVLM